MLLPEDLSVSPKVRPRSILKILQIEVVSIFVKSALIFSFLVEIDKNIRMEFLEI